MVSILVSQPARLGEGPVWDSDGGKLYYVDITGQMIFCVDPVTGARREYPQKEWIGCVIPGKRGSLYFPGLEGLYHLDPSKGAVQQVDRWHIPDDLRFNDGKCDGYGHLWLGAMYRDQKDPRAAGGAVLYRFDVQRGLCPVLTGLSIPNGMCWNKERTVFYFIDTPSMQVTAYRYRVQTGELSDPQTAVQIPEGEGVPDGMCIDAQGNLWIALWGGSKVICCDPLSGKRLDEIPVPAVNVSCCCFGGNDLDTLFISSAMDDQDEGGQLFAALPSAVGTLPFLYERR